MSVDEINDHSYWNRRFEENWVENLGQSQSRFFSHVALELFPPWLIEIAKQPGISFCDWGCAMGDGTEVLRQALLPEDLHGIDFSEVAIARARELYPAIKFHALDLLSGQQEFSFDILFSSNTLEHFHEPWDVASSLAPYVKRFLCFLVPFQEPVDQRHEEHFYSFDWGNIRRLIAPDFVLVDAAVADVGRMKDPQWGGKQILLTYARLGSAVLLEPKLRLSGVDLTGRLGRMEAVEDQLRELSEEHARLRGEHDEVVAVRDGYEQQLLAWSARGKELDDQVTAYAAEVAELRRRLGASTQTLMCATRTRDELLRQRGRLEAECENLRRELESLRKERDELSSQYDAVMPEVIRLETRMDELAAEIKAVYASTSWRITSPLRRIRKIIS